MQKYSVIKTENGADERAVQIRADDPSSPVEGQVWYNNVTKRLAIFSAAQVNVINTRTLSVDPVSPGEGESWVNATENTLKYHFSGSTYTIQLSASPQAGVQPAGDYYAVLTEAELGQLSDSGILYPNYLIDDYQAALDNATYTNASAQGSALRLNAGQLTGKVEYELETSTVVDQMDGIAVASPRAMQPVSVVDNGNGTTTLVVNGDMTGIVADTKTVLVCKEITVNSQVRSIYLTDANGPAALAVQGAPVFAANQTTIVLNNTGINILTQLACLAADIRFFPQDITLQAGGNGIGGTLDLIPINDAHGLDTIRTLGGDAYTLITQDLKESITRVVAKKSPNGQYCLIAVAHTLPGELTEIVCYYSNDGMNTLNRIPGGLETGYPGLFNTQDNQGGSGSGGLYLPEDAMQVGDNGKCIFAHLWGNPSGYYHNRLHFADLTAPSPTMTPFAGFGGGPGIPYQTETNSHMAIDCVIPDDDFDYVYVSYVFTSNHTVVEVWYRASGATFLGYTSNWTYHYYYNPAKGRWYNNLEGEKQLVVAYNNANSSFGVLHKKKLSELTAALPFNGNPSAFQTNPAFDLQTREDIFAGTEPGHTYILASSFDDDKIRFIVSTNSNNNNMLYAEVNVLTPAAGVNEIQHLAFSAVPASGVYQLQFNAVNTANINFNDNALALQTKLRAISTINGPYVNVTGDYTVGFNITFVGVLGLSNQPPISVFSNTLLDGGAAPVTITPTTPTPGVAPIPITNNNTQYRSAGASDKVLMTSSGMGNDLWDIDFSSGGPGNDNPGSQQYGFAHRFKKHPTTATRAFLAFARKNSNGSYNEIDPMIIQLDDTTNFQGNFQKNDAGSNDANTILAATSISGTTGGDKVATLITFNRAITVKCIEVLGSASWNTFSNLPTGARTANHHIRAKLVGQSGGLPDETNVIEISPTIYNPYQSWTSENDSMFFRFNSAVTNGQQAFLVLYTENFTPNVAWNNAGQPLFAFLGSTTAPNGACYFQAGVWNTRAPAAGLWNRIYDYYIESVVSPDLFQYPRYSTKKQPSGNYFTRISEVQLELIDDANLLFTYVNGADYVGNTNLTPIGKRVIARQMAIQAAGTFVTAGVSQFLGYQQTIDPNLYFLTRLGDPNFQSYDRFGNLINYGGNPLYPRRVSDWAAGTSSFGHTGSEQFKLNDVTQGQQQDSRFKSGWCQRVNGNGYIDFYAAEYMCFMADNFTMEFEFAPTANDFAATNMVACYGVNIWYIQCLPTGALRFYSGNVLGPALSGSGNTDSQANTFLADTYYRVRLTRENDQLIHMYKWSHATPVWTEVSYTTQTNMNNQFMTPTDTYMYLGADYNNTIIFDGCLGEFKFVSGTNTFLNGDNVIDQRPIYGHANLGDRIIAKKQLFDGVVNADGDAIHYLDSVITATPANITGLVSMRDQLFKYTDTTLPTGKILAARVTLDRVSTADAPAVQGILLNFSKKPV